VAIAGTVRTVRWDRSDSIGWLLQQVHADHGGFAMSRELEAARARDETWPDDRDLPEEETRPPKRRWFRR
jgi:hypothetical protein